MLRHLSLLVFLAGLFATPCATAQSKKEYKVAAIGFYNLENLFDTLDNPDIRDEEFLPGGAKLWNTERYLSKQANMAKVISKLATEVTPDGVAILGVSEIENRKVLEDLVRQPDLRQRNYQIVHFDSPDERGIDCGLLYQPKYFEVLHARPVFVELIHPLTGEKDLTRDILYVSGVFDGDTLHIMVGHWPSRSGGESASAWARAEAASVCRQLTDSLMAVNPAARILIMGDLNDDPTNKSVYEVLNAKPRAEKLKQGELYNPMYEPFRNGNGTLAYRDAWNLFDQIIVSSPLVIKRHGGWKLHKTVIFRQPWLFQTDGAFKGYPLRTFAGNTFLDGYSDHLPVYLVLLRRINTP